ncbi:MAG: succinate dehydrogenase assembly factor 4 [Stellaceae bacterium]
MSAKPHDKATPLAQQPIEKPADLPTVPAADPPKRPREIGGPKGPEPTRYGDWEVGGRCTDF